jgi:hypothetical protein
MAESRPEERKTGEPAEPALAPEPRPPFGSWARTYTLVLLSHALVIALLTWLANAFAGGGR